MSVTSVVWLVAGLLTLALMTALAVGLIRHLKLLSGSLKAFQDEVEPVARQVAAEADRASRRAEALQDQAERLRR